MSVGELVAAIRSQTTTDGRRWLPVVVAVGVCLVMFLARLGGTTALVTPNEGLYAQAAREMLERHDWVLPHINGVLYLEKPPLLYWLTALSMSVFGPTEFGARLPSALAGLATALLLLRARPLGRDAESRAAATAILATSLGYAYMARQVMFDTALVLFMTWSLVAWWGATEERRVQASCEVGLALALGVLTKGFIALLLPGLIIAATCLATRDLRRLRLILHPAGLGVFLLVAAPWHVIASLRCGDFAWFYFVNEHLLRFTGQRVPRDFHDLSMVKLTGITLAMALPWTALLPGAFRQALVGCRESRERLENSAFVLCWVLTPVVFFAVSGSRANYYLLPILPPLALMIADLWEDVARSGPPRLGRRWVALPLGITSVIVLGGWLWALQRDNSRDGMAMLAVVSGWALVAGMVAATVLATLRRPRGAFVSLAGATALAWLIATVASGQLVHEDGERRLARLVAGATGGAEVVVAVEGRLEGHSSFVFYLPPRLRPVYMVEGRTGGDLEFGSRYPGVRHLFLSTDDLDRLARTRRVFYVTDDPPAKPVPASLRPLAHEVLATLWTNAGPRAAR